jgi:tetratricopeptide (TPR) repeat protein
VVASDSEQWWLLERIQWIQEVLTSLQRDISDNIVAKYSLGLLKAMEFERLGDQHFAAGNFDLALNEYDRALGLEASARAHSPIEVADLQVKIGDCFTGMKDYDAALQEYDNAERTYLTALGSSFRVVGQLYQCRGAIFLIQKNFDDALRSYAKAYAVFEQALGKEHELSMKTLQDIRLVTVKEKEELRNVEQLRPKNARMNGATSIKGNRARPSLNEYSSRRFSNSSFHS